MGEVGLLDREDCCLNPPAKGQIGGIQQGNRSADIRTPPSEIEKEVLKFQTRIDTDSAVGFRAGLDGIVTIVVAPLGQEAELGIVGGLCFPNGGS